MEVRAGEDVDGEKREQEEQEQQEEEEGEGEEVLDATGVTSMLLRCSTPTKSAPNTAKSR